MKRLNHISACRIALCIALSIYLNNHYLFLAFIIFEALYSLKESIIYTVLICLIVLTNSINKDFIKFGIVERKINNYYVVDKILYKTKIKDDGIIRYGDFVKTENGDLLDENYLKRILNMKTLNI